MAPPASSRIRIGVDLVGVEPQLFEALRVGDAPYRLLRAVRGLELVGLPDERECCGFGGTFSVFEEPVSAKMGQDKVSDHARAGAAYIVSPDMSCVMHQKGCAQRAGLPLKFIHIAQVLNGASA